MNVHQADQAQAALRDFAGVMRLYFDALVKQGFKPREALTIVIEYQRETLK